MSDTSEDCCQCKLERDTLELRDPSNNFYRVANFDLSGPVPQGAQTSPRVRGTAAGAFNDVVPVSAVVHSDWCNHRPTKALLEIVDIRFTENGTARVFVEGDETFTKYVWAEIEFQAAVAFPSRDARYHTQSGVAITGGPYGPQVAGSSRPGPVFAIANGQQVPQFRNLQDPTAYLESAWPLYLPKTYSLVSVNSISWLGTRCLFRWGYRESSSDTVLGELMFPDSFRLVHNRPEILGKICIGCNWADIREPNANSDVRCGAEVAFGNPGTGGTDLDFYKNLSDFGAFTIPFELPRSFFTDNDSSFSPVPPLPNRLVGLSSTANSIQVPEGQSTSAIVERFESVVTCGARRSNVFIPIATQSEDGVLPAGPVGDAIRPTGGIITQAAPVFVRRADLLNKSYHSVANADSWHATHLVHAGSALAGRNVLHNLHVGISPCTFSGGVINAGLTYTSSGLMRAGLGAVSGANFAVTTNSGVTTFNLATSGTQFSLLFATDRTSVSAVANQFRLPDAHIWDSISGQHTLSPLAPTGERFVPNAYGVFYDEPSVVVSEAIATPAANAVDPVNVLRDFVQGGVVVWGDAVYAEYDSVQVPSRLQDYRGEWTIETFPQIWATTRLFDGELGTSDVDATRVGPRQISLADSGMTTENHDAFSASSHRLDYVPEDAGATVTVFGRVGLKIALQRVRGFRRVRERQEVNVPFRGPAPQFVATNEVAVYGDYECTDVACDEQTFSFEIPLTGQEVADISAGQTVSKQLLAGTVGGVSVYRTVTVGVSIAS